MKSTTYLSLAALATITACQKKADPVDPTSTTTANAITASSAAQPESAVESFDLSNDQLNAVRNDGRWLGPNWWANRLHDWSMKDGAFVCEPNRDFLSWRVAHDMTREITGNLEASVKVKLMPTKGKHEKLHHTAMVGYLIGAGHSLDSRLAKALIFDFKQGKSGWPAVPGSGIAVGINGEGKLRIIDLDTGKILGEAQHSESALSATIKLTTVEDGDSANLTATATFGEKSISASAKIAKNRLTGGLGLLSHPGNKPARVRGQKAQPFEFASLNTSFCDYQTTSGITHNPKLAVGPVACTHYTVDRGILKLAAQCFPQHGSTRATLEFLEDGNWKAASTVDIKEIDNLALFRIENWDQSKQVKFRVSIPLDNSEKPAYYGGTITAEPSKDKVRLAALGCIIHRPWGQANNWNNLMFFPHKELQDRVAATKPDLVFFYGDQMYENTPSYVDRKNYHEDYMYKWLFHCIAFKETIRNVPSITIPDDHDVYQGNFWAEGGRKAPGGDWNKGGFSHPGAFVAQVHRTQTSHLPDAVNPNCLEQNIPAYFCDWNWGGVSFAVIGDRLFKSGPAGHGLPSSATNRPDHYNNPKFDTATLDLPGLDLLGKPQEDFLATWAEDWSGGAKMKAMLSQSPLGNLATHHHGTYLIADLDSNGWPQSGRKRALRTLRSARAVHIAGDQHLSTMVQHGIDKHDDGIFGFTAPAVANAYARAYHPTHKGYYYKTTPPTPDQYLGKRLDGFKNFVTFHAVANPDTRVDGPYHTAKQPAMNYQVPGFGIIDFDTKARTTTFMSLPRSGEVAKRLKNGNYPGWPVTVKQQQNDGRTPTGELIRFKGDSSKTEFPVVSVFGANGKLQWSQRMNSQDFIVHAYGEGEHTIKIDDKSFKAIPSKEGKVVSP